MDINIRPVKAEDAVFINEMRIMDGVMENILSTFSERKANAENFLNSITQDDHILVAEVEEGSMNKVAGIIGLHVNTFPRLRHSGTIGIMVHTGYQDRGIGTALFARIIDLADNWLMLKRLELDVFVDNERAIKLYKKFGFEIEGRKKYAIVRNGRYDDTYVMARYNM